MKYYKLIDIGGLGGTSYKLGVIYPEDYSRGYGYSTVSTLVKEGFNNFKLSTRAAYNKQEGIIPKPRVKKVVKVNPHEFKVGDYVEVINPGSSCNKKGDFGYITEICKMDKDCRVSKTNDKSEVGNWVEFTGIKLSTQTKLKQTKMENYSIEGSKALKTAFVEECGLKLFTGAKIDDDRLLTSVNVSKGTIQTTGKIRKEPQHFVLPKDWDTAVKYVTEFNTEPKFKVGDWVIGWHTDYKTYKTKAWEIGKLSTDYASPKEEMSGSTGINRLRLATPTEIEKATKVIFKAGDIVVITGNSNYSENKVGDIGICVEECVEEIEPHNNTIKVKGSGDNISSCWTKFDEMRMATAAEIKAYKESPTFKMAGYYSTINKSAKTISFGCQTYTKKEVKLLLDASELCARVGYNAKVKGSGFVVNETDILTPANLTKILEQLK